MQRKILNFIFYSISAIIIVAIGFSIYYSVWQGFIISLVLYLSLFVPGFILSYAIFNKLPKHGRPVISIILSIIVVPLIEYITYLCGLRINLTNYLIILAILIIISAVVILIKKYVFNKKSS